MNKNKQRGYMNLDGLGGLLLIIGGAIFVVGVIVGTLLVPAWQVVKPWIHSITG